MPEKIRGVIPRKIKGFRDITPAMNRRRWQVINAAARVYKAYGFEHWDTPVMEYAECIGKYVPDEESMNPSEREGIYTFVNPEQEPVFYNDWTIAKDGEKTIMDRFPLVLRYDLTAPLARVYAESLWTEKLKGAVKTEKSPLFRRYQYGPLYRFEAKLDPGRYREFWQLDFDSVGTADITADAEIPMILADAMEAIGMKRGAYVIKANNRKIVQGFLHGLDIRDEAAAQNILRIIDKLDKIGLDGVRGELGKGREDEFSKAFIPGLNLTAGTVGRIIEFFKSYTSAGLRSETLASLRANAGGNELLQAGIDELAAIDAILVGSGFDETRVRFDPTLIRGMSYYTGPVFEVASLQTYTDAKGNERNIGSIGGGGRYDGLVERLLGIKVPATGASIGIDRLCELLELLEQNDAPADGPVFICMFDSALMREYQTIAAELRSAGIPAEVYYGMQKGLNKQLAYADKKGCSIAILLGSDEAAKGIVSMKNLKLGREIAADVTDKAEWTKRVQSEVRREDVVEAVRRIL